MLNVAISEDGTDRAPVLLDARETELIASLEGIRIANDGRSPPRRPYRQLATPWRAQ